MMKQKVLTGFLLTRQWRDTPQGVELVFWLYSNEQPIRVVITQQEAVCFIRRDQPSPSSIKRKPLALQTLAFEEVDGLYFKNQRDLTQFRTLFEDDKTCLLESDIKPDDRFLMERFITASLTISGQFTQQKGYLEAINPKLKALDKHSDEFIEHHNPTLSWVSLDIETSDLRGDLYSIAVTTSDHDACVFMAKPLPSDIIASALTNDNINLIACKDESDTLRQFFSWLNKTDPDLILGWNVVGFDLEFLYWKAQQCGVPFTMARGQEASTVLRSKQQGQPTFARIPGRVIIDGIAMLRTATWRFDSFALSAVAKALLGDDKLIEDEGFSKVAEIRRLYRDDPIALARYNLQDCHLVSRIIEKTQLIDFAIQRTHMTGLAMGREGASVAAYDYLYLPKLHRQGFVAPDVGSQHNQQNSPGGYVMDSKPGLYKNVLVLDFKSLYPSIIRTFKIDPMGLAIGLQAKQGGLNDTIIEGYLDAAFSRDKHILPNTITELWQARDKAKRDNNAAMSQAIKILMNSFYGVLGAYGCRFFNPQLASSITKRGHAIITQTRNTIQQQGHEVIYGDTDSVFVWLGNEINEAEALQTGQALAKHLNTWWTRHLRDEYALDSHLEIEFETHYQQFFMPTTRGTDKGSKKRYAGSVKGKDGSTHIIYKGLESVRTDWTELSKQFQRELYQRVFNEQPYADYINRVVDELWAGDWDEHLVYCKQLRRPLDSYISSQPPHVKAAKKMQQPGKRICYVMTLHGPEPVEAFAANSQLKADYQHYVDKQLMPVADSILQCLNTSFERVTAKQLGLFDNYL